MIARNTEMAVAVSLAAVLDLFRIPLPHLLYGGSISLQALPLLVVALRHGARAGLTAGAAYGIANLIIKPIVVHPVQLLLDYPLAFGLMGGAGGAFGVLKQSALQKKMYLRLKVLAGILAANGVRLLVHFVSGVIFFAAYAPAGQPVWIYSLVYNASYLVPQAIFHIFFLQLILRVIMLGAYPKTSSARRKASG